MNNDLMERYIYAVTRRLPRKSREDVALELRGLIEDMLCERCGGLTPSEKDIRVVLTELGTPQELYAKYDEDADKCLIGQPYYTTYTFVLQIVLFSVAAGLTIANTILQLMEPKDFLTAILGWFNGMWNSLFGAFAFVTLLFAFFQRKGIRIPESFDFDDLPPVPNRSKETSRWESIAGIGFCVVFVVLFLLTPSVFSVCVEGMWIPIFTPEAIRESWVLILGFAACGILRESVQLLEGTYNKKVMISALVLDAVSAGIALLWLNGNQMMNPAFVGQLASIFTGETDFILTMFANFQGFFLTVILFALALDAIEVTVKTLRK